MNVFKVSEETMSLEEKFLEIIPGKSTKKSYRQGIKQFEEYLGYPVTKLIKSPTASDELMKFYGYLKEQGYTQNSRRNLVNGPTQFLKYCKTEIALRKALGIFRTEVCLTDHLLEVDQIQKMATIANLREKVILSVLILGLRASDAASLEREPLNKLDQEPPIPLRVFASKEGTIYRTYISDEFLELLKLYLPTIPDSKWLFPGKRKESHIDPDILNLTLQNLAKKAQIKVSGNLRWHCGRKTVLRVGSQLGLNQWSLKALTGKTISPDMATYLEGLQLKDDFLKLHSVLKISPTKTGLNGKMSDMEAKIDLIAKVVAKVLREMNVMEGLPVHGITGLLREKLKQDLASIPDEELLRAFLET